jgi:hydrogenase maturation protease HycI
MEKTQTSGNSWKALLNGILAQPDKSRFLKKLAVVGIGNEFNGDDAAGVLIARRLTTRLSNRNDLKVFDGGQALENITGALIRFKPDILLFIDAVSIGDQPGSIQLLDWRSSTGFTASTHSLPLSMVVEYILHEHKCQVYLLGIQIKDTTVGSSISTEVNSSIKQIVSTIISLTRPSDTASTA